MAFDLLIQGGTVIDGSGKPRIRADVGIAGGRIKDIGDLAKAKAEKTLDASGKFVAPGFVDITSRADCSWSLFSNPHQDYLLSQGVTTILVGNCGTSLAPLVSREAVEAFKKSAPLEDLNINWATVAELLAELGSRPLGVNVATLVGHGTIRRGILKGAIRPLAGDEFQQLAEAVEAGMTQGAFGLSLGLSYSHEVPATASELTAVAKVLAGVGGLFKPHLRSEGSDLAPAVNETVALARESGVRVVISHLKAVGRRAWPVFPKVLDMIERAHENGVELTFDISPYLRTGSYLYQLLPPWARAGGFGPMLDRIRDAPNRARILEDLKAATIHADRYVVAQADEAPGIAGKTIAEIAENTGASPEETILELLAASAGRVTIFGKTLSYRNLTTGIAHPLAIVASNGSGVSSELAQSGTLVHPRSTGAFPHFLHTFVKESDLLSWEEGIRKITGLPAEAVGFQERGRIAEKYHADIVVFDPEQIRDRSSYQNPYVHSAGIEAVIVNGQIAIENGQLTGAAAGQVLRKD